MNCEELVLSVVVILLLMLLIAFVCVCMSPESETFTDPPVSDPRLQWGGVSLKVNNVMDHGNTGYREGKLPLPNSMTAIRRSLAEDVTPPWSSAETPESNGGVGYAEQFLAKRDMEHKRFPNRGFSKGATGVRYMKMEK
jgi:hypothetical protein